MPARLALGSHARRVVLVAGVVPVVVVAVACGRSAPDGASLDSGSDLTDAGTVASDAPVTDASVDAAVDANVPDTVAPAVESVSPQIGSAVWLHAPIRVVFDEPLDPASIRITASAAAAGTPIAAQVTFEPPRTLAIALPASARGIGTLALELAGSVTDLAGNTHTAPIDLTFALSPWSSASVDRGAARSAPELAVGANGTVWAAWLVGNPRRAVVGALVGNDWYAAGGELGAGDVSSLALALDSDGTTLAAWSEGGQAQVARWTASGWSVLGSPGPAISVALAVPAGGAPIVALFGGSTVAVRELNAGTWQPIGADIALPAPIASSPSLAALAAGKPAVGWIDTANQLRVFRFDATWTELSPLSVGAGAHMSLAARSAALAVAWQQHAGSWGVLAAQAAGTATSWTRLGRALDIDSTGDAIAPAIAYDASGAPVVAWTELVETQQRGALARWTGSAWQIAGGVSWLDATAAPQATRIALHAGGSAVVSTVSAAQIRIARLNGPRVAAPGIATRASIAGCAFDVTSPPPSLAATGCFDLSTPGRPIPHPGLVPFDVVSELWSDGAKKRRYLGLPDGTSMTVGGNGAWLAPVGTMLVKQFDLETTPGAPSTRRPVETRFLVHHATLGWQGFSYRWNAAGTNATLLAESGGTFAWATDNGSQHTHLYPSRAQCRSCHHASNGPLLGLRSEQLARWNDYGGVIADQLATLSAIGIAPVASATPLASPHDPAESVERRMRGYMAANCAHCHNPQYQNFKDLRFSTPLANTKLCSSITPGSPSSSRVYQLVTSRPGMPALGSLVADPFAGDLLATWIAGMASCP